MSTSSLLGRVASFCLALVIANAACPAQAALIVGSADVPIVQSFNSLTSASSLPSLNTGGWRLWTALGEPTFAGGLASPTLIVQSTTLNTSSGSGQYAFRDASTTDRALGFIVSSNLPRHIMLEIKNETGSVLQSLTASWNLEKYRNGKSPLAVSFFHSNDGVTWASGGIDGVSYDASDNYNGTASPESTSQTATLVGLNSTSGAFHYLRWEFARTGGSDQTPAVGLDNFSISGATHLPEGSSWLPMAISGAAAWQFGRFRRRL